VRILASQQDSEVNAGLRKFINQEENISQPTIEAYFEANRRIHRRMVELTHNRYLLEMFDNIWNRGVSFQLFAAIDKVDLSKSLGDHLKLVDAIETGNAGDAMETMVAHIADGFDLQIEALDSQS